METKVAFKAMYKAIRFSNDAATKPTDTEVVDSMPKLSNITSTRASKIWKAIRSPGGAGAWVHVTEGAEHNLVIAVAVALNASCVLRTIECADIRLDPSDLFDLHEGQQLLEGQWVNKEWADAFRPLSKNDLKRVGRSSERTSVITPRMCAEPSPRYRLLTSCVTVSYRYLRIMTTRMNILTLTSN